MTIATDITIASIWEDGDVTEMARFQVNGANGTQADVTSIVRKIFNRSASNAEVGSSASLTVADVVFDTLQEASAGGRWTKDSTGYNFKDRVPATKFADGGETYRVEYLFTGSGGEKFWIVFEHPVQEVLSS